MSYQALYRAWRPDTFSEICGQDAVTRTLKRQVMTDHIAHAYLFCGTRGTGKTTAAKVLSRAINCLNPQDGDPCGECEICRALKQETSMDVMEIDAASNNGVDEIRDLREKIKYPPAVTKYKVYIIDEVHMLSTGAFNALLKTLEEPPQHAVFILATTEPQRLPATILSRCQRFDFHRLTVPEIMGYMQYILKADGAQAEPDGLRIIARAADGGMRDALSLLDQCLSFCHGRVTAGDVESILGIMDESFLFDMAEKLLTGDGRGALMGLDEVVRQGRDMTVFAGELAGHMRSLLLAKACGDCADMLSCTQDRMARYQQQAAKHSNARILYAMEQLMGVQNDMRYYPSPRMLLETVLVRIAQPVEDRETEALAARIALLEEKLKVLTEQGIPAAPAAAPAAAAPAQPVYEEDYLPEPPPEEGYLPEEAYEPPAAPAPAPAPEPAPKPIEERPPAPAPAAAPAAPQGPASANEADALWKQVLAQVQKVNALIHKSAAFGQATALTEDQLTVSFAPVYAGKMKMINARNQAIIQGELDKLKPGVRLLLREGESDGDVADLVGLFKDKLTIT